MKKQIATGVLSCVLAGITATAFAQSDAPTAQRTIREASAPTGSSVRRQLIAAPYPLNQRYDQMSAADKRLLHESWESIPPWWPPKLPHPWPPQTPPP